MRCKSQGPLRHSLVTWLLGAGKSIHTPNVCGFLLLLLATITPTPGPSSEPYLTNLLPPSCQVLSRLLCFSLQPHSFCRDTWKTQVAFSCCLFLKGGKSLEHKTEAGKVTAQWVLFRNVEVHQDSDSANALNEFSHLLTLSSLGEAGGHLPLPTFVWLVWNMVSFISFLYLLQPLSMATTRPLPR